MYETVLARIYLGAVLPLLEDVLSFDASAKQAVAGWNLSLQFRLAGTDLCTTLNFTGGDLSVNGKSSRRFPVRLTFRDAAQVTATFGGRKAKQPSPNLAALFHLRELSQLEKILSSLSRYLAPSPETLRDPDVFAFCVRLSFYALAFGLKQVGEHDPDMLPVARRLPDGTMEIRVDGEPIAHVAVEGGRLFPARGGTAKPNAVMDIKDLETAWAMLQGGLDIFAAVGSGRIRLRGYLPLPDGLNPLIDRLAGYLAGNT